MQTEGMKTPAAPQDPIRVVVVDDHRMFRTGVKAELMDVAAGRLEIIGEAPDVDTAIAVIRRELPDVVLLDVHLPGGNGRGGVDVLAGCVAVDSRRGKPVRFLALSVSDAAEDVIQVIHAGARGYVTKTITGTDLATAVCRVADGDAVFSPRLAGFVLDAFAAGATDTSADPAEGEPDDLDRLTPREREVMRYIARGYTYRETAAELFLSVKTIETHVSAVLRKLQLSNRRELERWASARRLT